MSLPVSSSVRQFTSKIYAMDYGPMDEEPSGCSASPARYHRKGVIEKSVDDGVNWTIDKLADLYDNFVSLINGEQNSDSSDN